MKFFWGLSSVALVSWLSVNSGTAVANVPEKVSNPISFDQTKPVMVADLFRNIQNSVETIRKLDSQNQIPRQNNVTPQENQQTGKPLERQSFERTPVQVSNEELYQRMAKRSDESYENWYDRIYPIIYKMRKENYLAWKATLSSEDNQAYDAITKKRNNEAGERMNQAVPEILRSVIEENSNQSRSGYCRNHPGAYLPGYGYCQ